MSVTTISNTKCAHRIISYSIIKGQSSVTFIKTSYIMVNESTTSKKSDIVLGQQYVYNMCKQQQC